MPALMGPRVVAPPAAEFIVGVADRAEVEAKRATVAAILGDACQGHDILYSTRILKKTGLRLRDD